jgi:hypothetical protein
VQVFGRVGGRGPVRRAEQVRQQLCGVQLSVDGFRQLENVLGPIL